MQAAYSLTLTIDAFLVGNDLLILGGVSAFATSLSTVERFDAVKKVWLPDQPCLPQPLAGPRCFVAKFEAD